MSALSIKPPRTRPAADTVSGEEMTVEALSAKTGVSVRNIRAYQTAGLLSPPRLQGRIGLYDAEHQGKLELIRDLRQQGFRLDAIRDMLDKTPQGAWTEYSLISDLFSTTFFTVEEPKRRGLSDLVEQWQMKATPEQKERITRSGLYRQVGNGEALDVLSPALERIGIQLAELNVPLDTVLDLQDELIGHTRAIAKTYVEQLFLTMAQEIALVQQTSGPSAPDVVEALQGLFERLRPLAIGSISAAFPVVLQQEFDRSVKAMLKPKSGSPSSGTSQG